jgi:hypothetical protein
MNRIIYFAPAFFLAISIVSCNERPNNISRKFTEDLFATTDTSLFHHVIQTTNENADTAFQQSTIVAVCKIITIDSNVHEEEKAPFYLIAASIDTLLKGDISLTKKLYFISYREPAFKNRNAKWVVYLSKIRNAGLFDCSNVEWQYLNNAPFSEYVFKDGDKE